MVLIQKPLQHAKSLTSSAIKATALADTALSVRSNRLFTTVNWALSFTDALPRLRSLRFSLSVMFLRRSSERRIAL